MSTHPSDVGQFHRTANYVDRVLRGQSLKDFPVQEPVKFEFVINLKTAKTLGLTASTPFFARPR